MSKSAKDEVIVSYKGFDKDLKCRDFQFEVGKEYEHDGEAKACQSGFHACEYPLDVFNYYNPAQSQYCIVEQSGQISKETSDSKVASTKINIKAKLSLSDLVKAAVDFTITKVDKSKEQTLVKGDQSAATNTGYRSAATNTGDRSAATNTGYRSAATNTGDRSAATNTGYRSAATNTGDRSAATNTGYRSAATNTGYQSAATNTGDQSAATNTGYQSAATNTGYQSAATNTGDQSAATNTGDQSAATNTGDQSAATNTGDQSAAETSGKNSIAAVYGAESKAKATKGNWIVVTYRDVEDEYKILHIKTAQAGVTKGVKADTWYTLDKNGKFIEVAG